MSTIPSTNVVSNSLLPLYAQTLKLVPTTLDVYKRQDYVNIVELAEAGEFGNVIIDGPLDVKTSCEKTSGDIKGIVSPRCV